MSCLRFRRRPRTTHRNCSTRSAGGSCCISCSSSRGPKCARDLGMTLSNRLRNMTMNCEIGEPGLRRRDRALSRLFADVTRQISLTTYCNVWIVRKNKFVGRGGLPLARRRRHLLLPCHGDLVLGDAVEELQDAILGLQFDFRLIA